MNPIITYFVSLAISFSTIVGNFEAKIQEQHPNYISVEHTEEDTYLLAQLISQEAKGEDREGWVAVGSVVKNRILSPHFKEDDVNGTVYAPDQFSGASCVKYEEPTEEMIEVAENVLSGKEFAFVNEGEEMNTVLFFRNPGQSTADWGRYKYVCHIGKHAFYSFDP